jgi:hypothetical protein
VIGGNGTVSPTSGTYNDGEIVTLSAIPDSGYRVLEWNGTDDDSSTSNTNTVIMASDKDVTVEFEQIPNPPSDGGSGGGCFVFTANLSLFTVPNGTFMMFFIGFVLVGISRFMRKSK